MLHNQRYLWAKDLVQYIKRRDHYGISLWPLTKGWYIYALYAGYILVRPAYSGTSQVQEQYRLNFGWQYIDEYKQDDVSYDHKSSLKKRC